MIEIRDVTKSYGGRKIINMFSATINKGDFISITGESGNGKTTLLNLMGLLEKPDDGYVAVEGVRNPGYKQFVRACCDYELILAACTCNFGGNRRIHCPANPMLSYKRKIQRNPLRCNLKPGVFQYDNSSHSNAGACVCIAAFFRLVHINYRTVMYLRGKVGKTYSKVAR